MLAMGMAATNGHPIPLDRHDVSDHDRWVPAKILVAGYPGMEPTLVDRFMADGTMPTFAELARSGRSFELENSMDHLPDATWPEIYTGRDGVELGWYRFPTQLFAGDTEPRTVRLDDFDLTAYWDHASAAGRLVAALDVPYTGSSPDINGIVLREWGTHDKPFPHGTDPDPSLFGELVARFGEYPLSHVHEEHTRCDDQDDTVEGYRWLRSKLLAGGEAKTTLFRDVLEGQEWDCFTCVFEEAHCAGHHFWHHHHDDSPWHDPAAPDDVRAALREIHVQADRNLAELIEAAGPEATVLVVLSHGMESTGGGWHLLDEVVVRLGYGSGRGAATRVRGRLPEPVKKILRTAVRGRARDTLRRAGGSLPAPLAAPETRAASVLNAPAGAIRLNVKGRDPFGSVEPGDEYDAICADIEEALRELVETRTGLPAVKRVLRTKQVWGDRLHANIPDLLIDFSDDAAPVESVTSARVGTVARPIRTPSLPRSGDHSTTKARVLAVGAGIEPAGPTDTGHLRDIAPTILGLLDVPIPETLNGRPLDLGARPAPLSEPAS
jgi:predicted AlkP superfamily phosphohydrolase/phosphomutase